MLEIKLTAAQWTFWQAGGGAGNYQAGFRDGVFATVDPDIDVIRVMQPDGTTLIVQVMRETTWV